MYRLRPTLQLFQLQSTQSQASLLVRQDPKNGEWDVGKSKLHTERSLCERFYHRPYITSNWWPGNTLGLHCSVWFRCLYKDFSDSAHPLLSYFFFPSVYSFFFLWLPAIQMTRFRKRSKKHTPHPRNSTKQLKCKDRIVDRIFKTHNLFSKGWSYHYERFIPDAVAVTYQDLKKIGFDRDCVILASCGEFKDTVLHEVAHVLRGSYHDDHDRVWERIALRIGCRQLHSCGPTISNPVNEKLPKWSRVPSIYFRNLRPLKRKMYHYHSHNSRHRTDNNNGNNLIEHGDYYQSLDAEARLSRHFHCETHEIPWHRVSRPLLKRVVLNHWKPFDLDLQILPDSIHENPLSCRKRWDLWLWSAMQPVTWNNKKERRKMLFSK
jgi:hypothetical protein